MRLNNDITDQFLDDEIQFQDWQRELLEREVFIFDEQTFEEDYIEDLGVDEVDRITYKNRDCVKYAWPTDNFRTEDDEYFD